MWDLPRPGLEPISPALAGGFLTTAPPGKFYISSFICHHRLVEEASLALYLIIYLFIYWLCWVFVAACGLSLVAVSEGYSFVTVRGLLIAVAPLVAEHWL